MRDGQLNREEQLLAILIVTIYKDFSNACEHVALSEDMNDISMIQAMLYEWLTDYIIVDVSGWVKSTMSDKDIESVRVALSRIKKQNFLSLPKLIYSQYLVGKTLPVFKSNTLDVLAEITKQVCKSRFRTLGIKKNVRFIPTFDSSKYQVVIKLSLEVQINFNKY